MHHTSVGQYKIWEYVNNKLKNKSNLRARGGHNLEISRLGVLSNYYLENFTSKTRLTNKCRKLFQISKAPFNSSIVTFMFLGHPGSIL